MCVDTDSDSGWSWLGRGEEDQLVHARFDQTQPSWLAALKLEATYTPLNIPSACLLHCPGTGPAEVTDSLHPDNGKLNSYAYGQ